MNNPEVNNDNEHNPQPGPSKQRNDPQPGPSKPRNDPQPGPSRPRTVQYDSSTSSDLSSSSDSFPRRKKKHYKHKRRNRQRNLLKKLVSEVNELRNQVQTPNEQHACCPEIECNVSGDLYEDFSEGENKSPEFTFNVGTSLKEGTIPKTTDEHIKTLNRLQRFDLPEWTEVRFSEVQKPYLSTPGYTSLDCNDEITTYDNAPDLAYAERAYAALTKAVVKQQEALQEGFREFLSWTRSPENLTQDKICDKINSIFKGEYYKISNDLLQMTCGRRADFIEQRRSKILASVRDPLIKTVLRKIPPSSTNLFSAQSFTSALEKVGGVRRAFTFRQKPRHQAAQAGNYRADFCIAQPAQGCVSHNNNAPAQGARNVPKPHNCYHSNGQRFNSAQEQPYYTNTYRSTAQAARGNFRNRRGNQRSGASQKTRKRDASPSYRESQNKRRKY